MNIENKQIFFGADDGSGEGSESIGEVRPPAVNTELTFGERTLQRLERLVEWTRQIGDKAASDAQRRRKILQDSKNE